jgi:hypothetical protein
MLGSAKIVPFLSGPPSVTIIEPDEGQSFLVGNSISLRAASQNFTDAVATVEFFAGTNSLAVVTNTSSPWGYHPLNRRHEGGYFSFAWTNAPTGDFALTALATDANGNSVTSAPVDISVVTNIPPVVSLVKPRDGAVILGPTNLKLIASAYDPQGTVTEVEFFAGTNSLGVVTNTPIVWITNWGAVFPIRQTSYSLTWSNVSTGDYDLTAVATDNGGVSSVSAPVTITVVSNLPPVVRIFNPEDGAHFTAPATVELGATVFAADGSISNVEFLAGTQDLGGATNGTSVTNYLGAVQTWYQLTWSQVPIAAYSITAVATDYNGNSGTSAPVNITVTAPPPPSVRLVRPENGETFLAPASFYLTAVAQLFPGQITQIQFQAGTNTIGIVTNPPWPTNFKWTNVPPGSYDLTAVATDSGGVIATSPPVNISVVTNHLGLHPY